MLYISFKQIVCHDIAMRFFLGNLIWSKQFKNVKQLDLVFCNATSSNLYYILELQYHLLKYNIIRCLHIQYYCTCTIIIQQCSRSLIKKKNLIECSSANLEKIFFLLQICLRMASCRLQSTNVNCHLKGLHIISDFS